MESSVGTLEAIGNLSGLLERVEKGESITITRDGTPVARLVPTAESTVAERRTAIEEWLELRKGIRLGPDLTIRQLIDEGRR